MLNIRICVPCKDKTFLIDNTEFKVESKKLEDENIAKINVSLFPDNKLTLTEFGNKMIEESKNEYDYLILMHSDVNLSIYDFVKHLILTNGKYNVVGMAGTKKLFVSQTPLTWFTGSHKYPNERYGKIVHNHDGLLLESFFNKDNPEVLDTEVITIDGLLMCLDKKTMLNDKARFDEIFTYDFYDLDFCLNIQFNTDLKIGVFVQQTIHQSLGKSVLTEEYLVPERKFREKYQKQFNS